MADSDSTLKILIQLGVIGKEDVAAVKDLLQQTGAAGTEAAGEMTESMPENLAAWKNYSKTMTGAAEETEGFQLRGRELYRVMGELNRIVPGAGEAFKGLREMLMGGGGELAVFCLAIQAATEYWNLYTAACANAAAATASSLDKIRSATATARTELEDFNKALAKASQPTDPEAEKLAQQRAILDAQYKAKKELLKADEDDELQNAPDAAARDAVKKKYATANTNLESQHEADDLNLVNTIVAGLKKDRADKDRQRQDLEDDKLAAAQSLATVQKLGLNTDTAAARLADINSQLKTLNEAIVQDQTKITKYSGESSTAGAVHGINDFERDAVRNRTISRAVTGGIDPAQAGAALTDEQRNANIALSQLFSQFIGGQKAMMSIIKFHLEHSTSQQQEIQALNQLLATLQAQTQAATQSNR